MARINEIGAHRIAYPDRPGEKVMLQMRLSEKDELVLNGVKISVPKKCYNVFFE